MTMRRMTVGQIDALLAVARSGTFQEAAHRLNVTQPTISLRIKELETALGVTLFDRSGRRAKPTPEGLIAIRYAGEAVGLLDDLSARLGGVTPLHGVLRLGASEMIAMTCLPEIVARIEAEFDSIRIELTVENSNLLYDDVVADVVDIAILARQARFDLAMLEPIASVPIAWVGSPAKRLPQESIRPEDLVGINIVSLPPGSPIYSITEAWCAPSDALPARKFRTCNSTAVIARLVTSGLAMSVLPLCVLQRELDAGEVICYRQDAEFTPMTLSAAFSRTVRPAHLRRIVELVREIVGRQKYFYPTHEFD
jgi:DNA-binding transcriptional LysR family regulator